MHLHIDRLVEVHKIVQVAIQRGDQCKTANFQIFGNSREFDVEFNCWSFSDFDVENTFSVQSPIMGDCDPCKL